MELIRGFVFLVWKSQSRKMRKKKQCIFRDVLCIQRCV